MGFKTPIGMSSYKFVYGKVCHLPLELEHKALWALKSLNLNWNEVVELRLGQLNELDEFRLEAYKRADIYKEKMKKYHDWRIEKRDIQKGDWALLFNFNLKLFLGKLKPKWSSPFKVKQIYSSGVVELENKDGSVFNLNGKQVKLYIGPMDLVKCLSTIYLDEV
ncbi:uncharacterized protein LOC107849137 [Capsicum annuum]|uniref:uncharacterized protein LOC107849137 n=1 Tax=Capsicum annuum TaxID=4072 RepID=UPI0007BEFE6B|nr:uncharacterized protein LOC107849137 [Capsicum annuum]